MLAPRKAFTLTELLISLLIVSILFGLLLQGVAFARSLANQSVGKRRLSALYFATEQFAAAHDGKLPSSVHLREDPLTRPTVHQHLLWFMDGGWTYEEHMFDEKQFPAPYCYPAFVSPGDYSIGTEAGIDFRPGKLSSFPANAQLFGIRSQYPKTISDGTSNTILFTERLALCNGTPFQTITNEVIIPEGFNKTLKRRPTFADGGTLAGKSLDDIYPITDKNLQTSRSSVPGFTFQAKPSLANCDPRIPQGIFGNLTACLADGSVRSLSPGITNPAFWAMVTPAGSETAGE